MSELIYTWREFFVDAEKLALQIAPNKPKSLIAVTRGGLFLAGMLGEYLDIPIIETVSIKSYDEQEQQELKILKKALTDLPDPLIVDDIVDSGATLKYLIEQYNAKSCVLFYKPDTASVKPDYYLHETESWVKFPWEVRL